MDIADILMLAPVVPVLVIDETAHARLVAESLVAGGLCVLEVTLRTPAALEVVAAMRDVAGAIVGAGSVVSEGQVDSAVRAGAQFLVSPGLTEKIARKAVASGVPYLPGINSASDIMRGMDFGLTHFKFFPAEASGGIQALRALAGPFPNCRFCPTGGITFDNAPQWLALPTVLCVGGSWLVSSGIPDPHVIRTGAEHAASLRRARTTGPSSREAARY